ncbi:MAG: rhodanese-like domain-containing protein [Anaerolineae bacterium]|nr:rhodanese-like domain-containing protein [Anaerolineae bacterium]
MTAEISPKDLKARLDAGETIAVIDVREDWEVARGMIDGATHIVMNDIPDSLDQIPKDQPVVFVCKSGRRSEQVTDWVAAQGYPNVLNMSGGVMRWTQEVDPSFPGRY